MKTRVEIKQLGEDRWEVFYQGFQCGIYSSLKGAKASGRRKVPSHWKRLEWKQVSETHWEAYVA